MTAMNHKKSPFRTPKGAGVTVGEVLVLGAGIEPATRGFSGRVSCRVRRRCSRLYTGHHAADTRPV